MKEKFGLICTKGVTLSIAALLFLGTISHSAAISTDQTVKANELVPPSFEDVLSWLDLKVGDVVAQGIKKDNSCFFDSVRILIQGPSRGMKRSLDLRVDEACQLKVNGKYEGPSDLATNRNSPNNWHYKSLADARFVSLASQKTVTVTYWMYGEGGELDKLTQNDGSITFTYDGSVANLQSYWYNCWADEGRGWIENACVLDSISYSGAWVYIDHYGNYSLSSCSPSCYNHTLHTQALGASDGTADCGYQFEGNIVLGVRSQCDMA